MTELLKKIGQLFIVGFPGQKPSSAFLNFVSEENIGGVILFRSNCPTHQAIHKNIQLIKEQTLNAPPFFAVDQEGGRVCRITGAPAEYGAAAEYGKTRDLEHFAEDFGRSVLCMEKLGINLVLGPVCDLYLNDLNDCLRDRCFGRRSEHVIPFVEKAVETLKKYGLLSCLKHFPGLGAAEVDPHQATAVVSYDELIWDQREKLPFAAGIERGADMIMTTHVRVPAMDKTIVTGSEAIVTRLLRKCLAFDGPIVTDDLTMKGADCLGHIGDRTVAAFNAGHDLLLFGQDIDASMEAFEYFKNAVTRNEVSQERLVSALERVTGIKFKLGRSAVF